MNKTITKQTLLLFVICISVVGCTVQPSLDDNIKSELGTIGVAGYQYPLNQVSIQNSHGKLQGTVEGAAAGFFLPLAAGLSDTSEPLASLLIMATAPFFAAGGAIYGGLVTDSPLPEDIAELNQNKINSKLNEPDMQNILRDRIQYIAREQTNHNIVPLNEHGPADRNLFYDYTILTDEGIDTVLEAGISRIETTPMVLGETGLIINADVRLVTVSDGSNIFQKHYQVTSLSYSLAEWGEDDARLIKETFDKAADKIARQIMKDFLITNQNITVNDMSVLTIHDVTN